MKKYLFYILCLCFVPFEACKPIEGISVSTSSITNITTNSAQTGGVVSVTGNYIIGERGICYSTQQYPTFKDSHTSDGDGAGNFATTLSNLSSETTYYIRAYVNTSSGVMYGNQLQFTTKDDITISYGSGTPERPWGLKNGGTDEWAVMFPSNMLAKYNGMKVLRVKVYSFSDRAVNLKIYSGGTNRPTTQLISKAVYLSKGWNRLETFTPFLLNTAQSLWVSLTCTCNAGEYPSAASAGINNKNARWKKNCSSGVWYDAFDYNNNVDLCWMIQVQVGTESKSTTLSYPQSSDNPCDSMNINISDDISIVETQSAELTIQTTSNYNSVL